MEGSVQRVVLTRDDCEALALTSIPADLRLEEPELMARKWFDYRLLHPVQATLHFAHQYERAVRDAYERTRDRDSARLLRVLDQPNVLAGRDGSAFWQARQACDRVGCRYDFALRWIMTRFADRGWRVLPRPNQIYGVEVVMDLDDAWKVECAASMQFPRAQFYHAEQYAGHPDQVAYQRWLIEQIRARTHEYWRPVSRALGAGALDRETVLSEFGPETLRKAVRFIGL